jgi:cytosine/adenosine deaminase-related metal-dependent hydrolase
MAAGSILALLAWLSSASAEAEEQAKADVVMRNGKIYTADKERSIKQAIALKGNTIVAVGSDADVSPLIGSGTKVIDLGGKLVLPGFINTPLILGEAVLDDRLQRIDRRLHAGKAAFGAVERADTINAAYAMKQDKTTGSLEAGKRADLVVLDRDLLTVDPETIQDTKVLATYLDGRLVHSAPAGGKAEGDDEEKGDWWDEREARMREWLHRD